MQSAIGWNKVPIAPVLPKRDRFNSNDVFALPPDRQSAFSTGLQPRINQETWGCQRID
jgi:hypothetical protein